MHTYNHMHIKRTHLRYTRGTILQYSCLIILSHYHSTITVLQTYLPLTLAPPEQAHPTGASSDLYKSAGV